MDRNPNTNRREEIQNALNAITNHCVSMHDGYVDNAQMNAAFGQMTEAMKDLEQCLKARCGRPVVAQSQYKLISFAQRQFSWRLVIAVVILIVGVIPFVWFRYILPLDERPYGFTQDSWQQFGHDAREWQQYGPDGPPLDRAVAETSMDENEEEAARRLLTVGGVEELIQTVIDEGKRLKSEEGNLASLLFKRLDEQTLTILCELRSTAAKAEAEAEADAVYSRLIANSQLEADTVRLKNLPDVNLRVLYPEVDIWILPKSNVREIRVDAFTSLSSNSEGGTNADANYGEQMRFLKDDEIYLTTVLDNRKIIKFKVMGPPCTADNDLLIYLPYDVHVDVASIHHSVSIRPDLGGEMVMVLIAQATSVVTNIDKMYMTGH